MILEIDNWHVGYLQLLNDCRNNGVLIVCSLDVDALCSARLLTYLLRQDSIYYKLTACASVSAIQQQYDFDRYDSVVLLNLGSNVSSLTSNNNIYIMDHRRPVHLQHLHADNVIIFWDGTLDLSDIPSDGDNLSGQESSSSEEEEDSDSSSNSEEEHDPSDDEDEAEFGEDNDDDSSDTMDINQSKETVETASIATADPADNDEPTDYDGDAEKEEDDKDDDLSISKSKKPKTLTDDDTALLTAPTQSTADMSIPKTPKELHEDRRDRIRKYYSEGTFYGAPSSFVCYKLVQESRFETVPELLWLAMVGTTDNYNSNKLDLAGYSQFCLKFTNMAEKLFPNDEFSRVQETTYAEELLHDNATTNAEQSHTRIGFSKAGQILVETDFRLFLLRQTNLYDSLVHSDYVSTALQLPGNIDLLKELLAKCGISLQDAHQEYRFVLPKTKRLLSTSFAQLAPDYNLDQLEFTSFFRVTKYRTLVSALDTSYCVSAILDQNGFEAAYDALGELELSEKHVSCAIGWQTKLLDVANSVIERKTITKLSHFRYSYIEGDLSELSLSRLAKYLMDWYDYQTKLPLVLLSEGTERTLVVAHEPSHARNKFGQHFRLAAESMQGDFVFDSFDAPVVQMAKADAQKFLEQLHYLVSFK